VDKKPIMYPSNYEILELLAIRLKLSQDELDNLTGEMIADAQRIKHSVKKLQIQCQISMEKAILAVLLSAPPRPIGELLFKIKPGCDLDLKTFFESIPRWKSRESQLNSPLKIVHIGSENDPTFKHFSPLLSMYSVKSFEPERFEGFEDFAKSKHVDLVIVSNEKLSSDISSRLISSEPFAHCVYLVESKDTGLRDRRTTALSRTAKPIELSKVLVSASVRTRSETIDWLTTKRTYSALPPRKLPHHLRTLYRVIDHHTKVCKKMNSSARKCFMELSGGIGQRVFMEGMFAHFDKMPRNEVEKIGAVIPNLSKQINILYARDRRKFEINGSPELFLDMTVDHLPQNIVVEHIDHVAEYYHKNRFDPECIYE
jgi:hypothetical protein